PSAFLPARHPGGPRPGGAGMIRPRIKPQSGSTELTRSSILNRRRFLKASAAGAGLLAAPAIVSSRVLASSGDLNFVGWAGSPRLAELAFPAFTEATGIRSEERRAGN